MVYNVNYFIKKFEAIPEQAWTTRQYEDERGCKCALGHCFPWEERNELARLTKYHAAEINDGDDERYQQETPKQRILAALRDVAAEKF